MLFILLSAQTWCRWKGSLLVKNPLKAPEFQNAPHNVLRSTEMGAAQVCHGSCKWFMINDPAVTAKKRGTREIARAFTLWANLYHLWQCPQSNVVQQKELKAMYKQFRKEQPQGYIDKEEFREMMRQMGVVDSFLQDLIFNVFDEDKGEQRLPLVDVIERCLLNLPDGGINFQEFVAALSVMTRGDPTEKLECEPSSHHLFDCWVRRGEQRQLHSICTI